MTTYPMTEYLEIDLDAERWQCRRCEEVLGPADRNYKFGLLVRERDPEEVQKTYGNDDELTFAAHPDWARLLEYFCPGCGTLVETELLPPGHPPTHDIHVEVDVLKERVEGEQ